MAGRTGKWGGIAIRGHTCCTPAHHTAFMDAPGNGHMQSYQNTHFLRRAAQRQTEPAPISDFGTFCPSLPTTPRPFRAAISLAGRRVRGLAAAEVDATHSGIH